MAVYSQYNPATGQFEYFQGAPSAPQYGGDPAGWNWDYYGQADPQAYPDYWADPNGSLLAQAMQAGLGWTAPRPAAPAPAPEVRYANPPAMLPPELRYQPMSMHEQHMRANTLLGGNPYGLSRSPLGRAADWMVDTGRRAAEAQDWAEGIY